ncbi:MAG TPA: HAMP domain-containing sensor histidine kinase [Myxococcota bacterium]|nr:HAMP domain-containing sensor histidine kinase [Myxococcota bacterium]
MVAFPIQRVTANSIRRISYWALGVALLLLVAMGGWQAWRLQKDLETREIDRATRDLERQARAWDDRVAQRTEDWLQDIGEREELLTRQRYYRETVDWFDSFYKWEMVTGELGARLVFPPPAPTEALPELNANRCIRAARLAEDAVDPRSAPGLFVKCVTEGDTGLALFAATEAASRFLAQGRADEAVAALEGTGVPEDLDLRRAAALGLAPRRVAIRRLLHAEALQMADRDKYAIALLSELGREIVGQDGPVLEQTLDFVRFPILDQLELLDAPSPAQDIEQRLPAAERRQAAWKEVKSELSVRAERGADRRVVHDQYGSHFLLVYSEISPATFGAVQLNETVLLEDLMLGADDPASLVVTDSGGELLFGNGSAAASVSFPRLLSHLRLGFVPEYLLAVQAEYRAQFLSQLLPILVGGIIGVAALAARVTADRREQELLDRQREFATRVTHELKTPLAGIRVMAENLELGAASDPAMVEAFAGRIIAESDKLTARIEEVLAVARSRAPARPVPYDLGALVEDVLREWEPRFADGGVSLHRRLDPVDLAVGDVPLLRDCVVCLLDNAFKYRRHDHPRPLVEVMLRQEGTTAVLEVVDNGIGVPPNKRRAIFQPFARVEGPGRGKAGGHGLGLAFVSDAVSRHDGRVKCTDGIDGGARFVVHLPLSR